MFETNFDVQMNASPLALPPGIMLRLEIQRGKMPMRAMPYSKELGGTAGCTMRLIEGTEHSGIAAKERQEAKQKKKRELYHGDSWFTSRKLLSAIKEKFGHEYFGALKTNHSGTPKEMMEETMKDWPSGSYLVAECEELKLFIVRYKYNYKKKSKNEVYCVMSSKLLMNVFCNSLFQFACSLALGILDPLCLGSHTLLSGLTNFVISSHAKLSVLIASASIFPDQILLMSLTSFDKMNCALSSCGKPRIPGLGLILLW